MNKQLAIKILSGDVLGTEEQTSEAICMAIDALEEQRTGKWIKIKKHHYGTYHDFDYYTIRCSVCGNRPEKAWHLTPFCPNCGTKIEREDDD